LTLEKPYDISFTFTSQLGYYVPVYLALS